MHTCMHTSLQNMQTQCMAMLSACIHQHTHAYTAAWAACESTFRFYRRQNRYLYHFEVGFFFCIYLKYMALCTALGTGVFGQLPQLLHLQVPVRGQRIRKKDVGKPLL